MALDEVGPAQATLHSTILCVATNSHGVLSMAASKNRESVNKSLCLQDKDLFLRAMIQFVSANEL